MTAKKEEKYNAIEKIIDSKSIKSFREESAFRVLVEESHFFYGATAIIKYREGMFEVTVICDNMPNQSIFDDFTSVYKNRVIQFSKSGITYEINSKDIREVTQTLTDPYIVKFLVDKFYEPDVSENLYYRLTIPLKEKPNFSPFETRKILISGSMYFGLIKINLEGLDFEIFHFENKDLKEFYLTIDCLDRTLASVFEESVKTILKSYSLFTGNLYQAELYFTRNEKIEDWWKGRLYRFDNQSNNILSNLPIIHPREFRNFLKHYKREELAKNIGIRVNESKLAVICKNTHKNFKIERIINLILEGNISKSLILRCSTYSVALETLSNIICDSKHQQNRPIQDEKLAELINEKFKAIIEDYDFALSNNQKEILEKKIDNFNKPLNTDKLKLAFELMRIKLNRNDLKALKARNVFLHGSTPFKKFESNEKNKIGFSLFSNKMHLLLICLLLKYLGFTGAITNHYAFGKFNLDEEVDEHYFRILQP